MSATNMTWRAIDIAHPVLDRGMIVDDDRTHPLLAPMAQITDLRVEVSGGAPRATVICAGVVTGLGEAEPVLAEAKHRPEITEHELHTSMACFGPQLLHPRRNGPAQRVFPAHQLCQRDAPGRPLNGPPA